MNFFGFGICYRFGKNSCTIGKKCLLDLTDDWSFLFAGLSSLCNEGGGGYGCPHNLAAWKYI